VSGGLDEVTLLIPVDLVHVAIKLMARLALVGAARNSEPSLVGDNNWPTQVLPKVLLQARDGVLGPRHIDSNTIHDFHVEPLHMNADQILPLEVGSVDIGRGVGATARVRSAAA
jgi:hypothetical protein